MDFARYAIARPVNIWLMILMCVIGGTIGLSNIGRLEDPAFTIKQVRVNTSFAGASAVQVEREVTSRWKLQSNRCRNCYESPQPPNLACRKSP